MGTSSRDCKGGIALGNAVESAALIEDGVPFAYGGKEYRIVFQVNLPAEWEAVIESANLGLMARWVDPVVEAGFGRAMRQYRELLLDEGLLGRKAEIVYDPDGDPVRLLFGDYERNLWILASYDFGPIPRVAFGRFVPVFTAGEGGSDGEGASPSGMEFQAVVEIEFENGEPVRIYRIVNGERVGDPVEPVRESAGGSSPMEEPDCGIC